MKWEYLRVQALWTEGEKVVPLLVNGERAEGWQQQGNVWHYEGTSFDDWLKTKGREGWELVAVMSGGEKGERETYVLKRPVQEGPMGWSRSMSQP